MIKEVELLRQPGGWLRSSHSLKECVIAHWSSDSALKIRRDYVYNRNCVSEFIYWVGERSVVGRSQIERTGGRDRSENVGMSSENSGENPMHRKPKVSPGRLVRGGLVGP